MVRIENDFVGIGGAEGVVKSAMRSRRGVVCKISVTKSGRTDSCAYLADLNSNDMKPNRQTLFLSQEAFERLKARYPKLNEPWQSSEVEELKAMAADKVPLSDMSEHLGRTPNSLKMKLKSLGLYEPGPVPRAWTQEEETLLLNLYNSGVSFEEMSERLGRTGKALVSRLVLLRANLFPSGSSSPEAVAPQSDTHTSGAPATGEPSTIDELSAD